MLVVKLDRSKYPWRGVKKAEELDLLLKDVERLAKEGKIREAIIVLFKWKPHASIEYLAKRLGVSEKVIREAVEKMVAERIAEIEEV